MDYIYKNIKKIRLERGLKQKELADLLGFARSYMSMIESGQRDISVGLLIKIASALKVKPQALFNEEPKDKNIHSLEWLETYEKELLNYRVQLQQRESELCELKDRLNKKLGI